MNLFSKVVLILLALSCTQAWSHPVSFQGSTGVMGYHSPMISHNQINHSFRYWFATGVHYYKRPNLDKTESVFATGNFLLKRWNEKHFQANIYANVGVGNSKLGGTEKLSGISLVQFDIEDRNYYFLAKHSRIFNDERTDYAQSVVRVGITPYVEQYNGIHSWLILEWQKSDFIGTRDDMTDLTPFLRVFYRNLLFEIGQSFDGITKFNYITHF